MDSVNADTVISCYLGYQLYQLLHLTGQEQNKIEVLTYAVEMSCNWFVILDLGLAVIMSFVEYDLSNGHFPSSRRQQVTSLMGYLKLDGLKTIYCYLIAVLFLSRIIYYDCIVKNQGRAFFLFLEIYY